MENYRPLVWITGASSGIGRSVAIEMGKRNYRLILSGRNEQKLKEVSELSNNAEIIAFDVSSYLENMNVASQIKAKYGYIDIVFLNAGDCEYIDIKNFDSKIIERMIKTNFLSMAYAVEAMLPLLRQSKRPHLIGMSSSVAYTGLPRSEGYGASKAAIRNFFQALRIDLLPEKILVSTVMPGFIKTPLTDKNDFPMPGIITAEAAAKVIVNGIEKQKLNIIVPRLFVLTLRLISMLPEKIQSYLIAKMTNQL